MSVTLPRWPTGDWGGASCEGSRQALGEGEHSRWAVEEGMGGGGGECSAHLEVIADDVLPCLSPSHRLLDDPMHQLRLRDRAPLRTHAVWMQRRCTRGKPCPGLLHKHNGVLRGITWDHEPVCDAIRTPCRGHPVAALGSRCRGCAEPPCIVAPINQVRDELSQ